MAGDRDRSTEIARRGAAQVSRAPGEPTTRRSSPSELAGHDRSASRLGDVRGIQETFWAVRKLLEHLARHGAARRRLRRHPLGRAHVPRPRSSTSPTGSRTRPVLILCLARPDLLDVRPGWLRRSATRRRSLLEPLTEAETRRPDPEPGRRHRAPRRGPDPDRRGRRGQSPLRRGDCSACSSTTAAARATATGGSPATCRRSRSRRPSTRSSPPGSTGWRRSSGRSSSAPRSSGGSFWWGAVGRALAIDGRSGRGSEHPADARPQGADPARPLRDPAARMRSASPTS